MKFTLEDGATLVKDQYPSNYPNADYLKHQLNKIYSEHGYANFETLLDPYCDRILVDTGYTHDGKETVKVDLKDCPRNRDGNCSKCPHLVHHIYATAWCAKKITPMIIPV